MINNNDYRLVTIKNDEADGAFAKEYFSSNCLSEFFDRLNSNEKARLKTCNIMKLKWKDIYKNSNEIIDINGAVSILNRLRNNEIHFVFNDEFLTDKEFMVLDESLMEYYEILQKEKLLPGYIGEKPHFDSPMMRLIPSEKRTEKDFSFKRNLEKSDFSKLFCKEIKDVAYVPYGESSFDIACALYDQSERIKESVSFDELWDYVSAYLKHKTIECRFEHDVIEDVEILDDGEYVGTIDNKYMIIMWKGKSY